MNFWISSISTIAFIEPVLRIITYMAVITVLFKLLKAINIYIDKNSR